MFYRNRIFLKNVYIYVFVIQMLKKSLQYVVFHLSNTIILINIYQEVSNSWFSGGIKPKSNGLGGSNAMLMV